MSQILVISFSDLGRDPRVDRQIMFLRREHTVTAAGLGPPADQDVEFVDLSSPIRSGLAEIARQSGSLARLVAHRYETVYWEHPANRLALARLAMHTADLVLANDLSALPLACRVAGDAPVIFDAHELATEEQAHLPWWRLLMAPYVRSLLRTYLPQTAGMMTVAPGIAELYAREFGVSPVVVTNAPPAAHLVPSAVGSPVRLIHHGAALAERRLELMIEAVQKVGSRLELDLMLTCPEPAYFRRLQRLAADSAVTRFVDPVPQREIVDRCNGYDVGVYVLPPDNENQFHALPNKLFEFIQARLAVAIGPSPEMAAIVRKHDCGVVSDDFTAAALARSLETLTETRIMRYKQNADRAAETLNAESNRAIMLKLVDDALGG